MKKNRGIKALSLGLKDLLVDIMQYISIRRLKEISTTGHPAPGPAGIIQTYWHVNPDSGLNNPFKSKEKL